MSDASVDRPGRVPTPPHFTDEDVAAGVRAMVGKNAVIENWDEEVRAVLAAVAPSIWQRAFDHYVETCSPGVYIEGGRNALRQAAGRGWTKRASERRVNRLCDEAMFTTLSEWWPDPPNACDCKKWTP